MKPTWRLGVLLGAICLATLGLHAYGIFRPMIWQDDIQILVKSLTWRSTLANLWVPANEHAMPLGRLSTWLLVQLAGKATLFPLVMAIPGRVALLAAFGLLYLFVRRELGHPFPALIAAALFGVSGAYVQAVCWFAASFSLLSLDTLLFGLLAAQSWLRHRRAFDLALSALCAALAPGWFAIGILAGPLICLYLLAARRETRGQVALDSNARPGWIACSCPFLGSVVFLAFSLPRTGNTIMHLEHYDTKTLVEAFDPRIGVLYTARALVDNFVLGTLGLVNQFCPAFLVPPLVLFLAGLLLWWWRRARTHCLLALGLAFILLNYLLIYSARALWDYHDVGLYRTNWNRYHLWPQVGLTLLVAGGLSGRWTGPGDPEHQALLSRGQTWGIGLLILGLFASQATRALVGAASFDPEQRQVLQQIEEMDVRCREHHVAADTAREVLGKLVVPWCDERENGWDLLRGSDDPFPLSRDDARRALGVVEVAPR